MCRWQRTSGQNWRGALQVAVRPPLTGGCTDAGELHRATALCVCTGENGLSQTISISSEDQAKKMRTLNGISICCLVSDLLTSPRPPVELLLEREAILCGRGRRFHPLEGLHKALGALHLAPFLRSSESGWWYLQHNSIPCGMVSKQAPHRQTEGFTLRTRNLVLMWPFFLSSHPGIRGPAGASVRTKGATWMRYARNTSARPNTVCQGGKLM